MSEETVEVTVTTTRTRKVTMTRRYAEDRLAMAGLLAESTGLGGVAVDLMRFKPAFVDELLDGVSATDKTETDWCVEAHADGRLILRVST